MDEPVQQPNNPQLPPHDHDGINSPRIRPANFLEPVPISKGGTGQATAQAAVDALLPSQTGNSGKFLTTNGNTSSWGALGGYYDNGTTGSTLTVDWNNGESQAMTLGNNCTLTLNNPVAGKFYKLKILQDSTGGRTVTWPASVKWPSSLAAPIFGREVSVTYDTFSHTEDTATSNSVSCTHTPGTGSSKVAIIYVTWSTASANLTGVTYDGNAATLIRKDYESAGNYSAALYYYYNPPSGAKTVTANFSINDTRKTIACATFFNASSVVSDNNAGEVHTTANINNTAGLSTNFYNDIVTGVIIQSRTTGITAVSGQTEMFNAGIGGGAEAAVHRKAITSPSSYTSQYDFNDLGNNSQSLVAIKPDLGARINTVYLLSDGTNYYGYYYLNLV